MSDQLLTAAEVMVRLKIGRTKLYELVNTGRLPSVKIDRARRFLESDVLAFIAQARKVHHVTT